MIQYRDLLINLSQLYMKKLSYLALMALLSTNLVAMAQTAPPSLPSFTLPTTTAPPAAPTQNTTPTTNTTPTSTNTPSSTATPQATGSTSFDLGGLDDFGSTSNTSTQNSGAFAAPINFGAYPAQQSYQGTPTFSGSMMQTNALGSRTYTTAAAAPNRVATTGPGALAALIPVAGYTLMTFRRKEEQ